MQNVTAAMSVQCHRCYSPYSSFHTTCFWGHGTGTITGLSSCKRHFDVVLGQTWQNSDSSALTSCFVMVDSKNPFVDLGETSLFRSKNLRQTLNISWFAYLSVTSSPMIEKKASSFWIGCATFARIYSPVMRMTYSCTVFEVLVIFLLPVSKCSLRFLIRVAQ